MMPAMPSSKKNHQMLDCWGCKAVVVMGRTSLLRGCRAHSLRRHSFIEGHSLHPAGANDVVLRFRTGIEALGVMRCRGSQHHAARTLEASVQILPNISDHLSPGRGFCHRPVLDPPATLIVHTERPSKLNACSSSNFT